MFRTIAALLITAVSAAAIAQAPANPPVRIRGTVERIDRTHLTVVGRILARLGIEHIPSYSPQARGRVERLNRTLQDRLVNELRVGGIATLDALEVPVVLLRSRDGLPFGGPVQSWLEAQLGVTGGMLTGHHAPYLDVPELFAEELRPILQKLSS